VSALEEAEALCTELQGLYERTRIRAEQIALSRCYWQARRIADRLREEVAA
jgi:hypothetical protein